MASNVVFVLCCGPESFARAGIHIIKLLANPDCGQSVRYVKPPLWKREVD